MVLTFRYKNVANPDGEVCKTPVIPVTIYSKESIETTAILDSGADMSAMHVSMAEAIGIDLSGHKNHAFGIEEKFLL